MKRLVLRDEFEGSTHEQMGNLNYVFEKVQPYWDECSMLDEEERFRLAQCHAICIRTVLRNAIIDGKRWKIMKRLQQEEADRRGHGDPDKLYLYYPHHLVDEEYPLHQTFHVSYCEKDVVNIEKALRVSKYAGGYKLPADRMMHVETMEEVFNEMRFKLKRRFLM
ncbi:hypothetical protein VPHD480_0274 [Vibrio phage D480]